MYAMTLARVCVCVCVCACVCVCICRDDDQGSKGKKKGKKAKKKRRRGVQAKRFAEGFGTGIRAPPRGCHPVLQAWRDNCRVWVSRLFAFACPNRQALHALGRLGPLVEIGAGQWI